MIRLCREYDCPVHIVHLSSAEALPLLIEARSEGLPLTVETCPHYLCLAAEEVPDRATEYKCAPPIRSAHNQERLWEALASGLIDLIATDHSPCPPALKAPESGDFSKAWGGIASLSVSLKAIWTAASQRGFDMNSVARWMASEPAQLAGLAYTKGELSPGFDADFVVFDGEAESTLTVEQLHFRHPVTPYLGRQLRGRVVQTLVRGETVFRDGAFVDPPMGRECPQVVAGVIAGSVTAVE
jgi:allantoinase